MNLIEIKKSLELLSKYGIIENFYLAGGTALALKYSHRESEDVDLFTFPERKISFEKLSEKIADAGKIINLKEDTLQIIINNVMVSLFSYQYPLLKPAEKIGEIKILLASDEDIACMKTIAVIQRGEKKDFFDLWFLMNKHRWNLSHIRSMCEKKFSSSYNHSLTLRAAVYFEDAEKTANKEIDPHWDEIKNFFRRIVKEELS